MGQKLNRKKIVLEYDEKDFCTLWMYKKFLTKHLKCGDKIPARVLNKFFSMFTIEENRVKEEFKNRSEIIKQKTLNRYLTDKKYTFFIPMPDAIQFFGKENTERGCSLSDMVESVFEQIEKNLLETNYKETFVNLVNSAIDEYFTFYQIDKKKYLSTYKSNAITGFIAFNFGFHLSKETSEYKETYPSNELLHQAIKYHTSKNKKKSK